MPKHVVLNGFLVILWSLIGSEKGQNWFDMVYWGSNALFEILFCLTFCLSDSKTLKSQAFKTILSDQALSSQRQIIYLVYVLEFCRCFTSDIICGWL